MVSRICGKIELIFHNLYFAFRSLFWKKDDSCVLFDCWFGKKFADNSRYLFQYLSDNKEELGLKHVVWVTHSKSVLDTLHELNYEAYMIDSKESIYYHKVCKYHFVNNTPVGKGILTGEVLADYSYGSKRINLWHGTGAIKNLGFESNDYKNKIKNHELLYRIKNSFFRSSKLIKNLMTEAGPWADNYFLTTSVSEKEKFKAFFCLPDNRILVTGYPRNAYKCKYTPKEENVIDFVGKYETVILYLPTFRSKADGFDMEELSNKIEPYIMDKNILFIQKAHSAAGGDQKFKFNNNILNLEPDFDINVITPFATVVVTDYSSILADAMYFNKPVVLFTPDYEQYMNKDRGLASDAEYLLSASFRFANSDKAIDFILKNYLNPDDMKKNNYKDVRERIWGKEDKHIEVIWKDILKQTI